MDYMDRALALAREALGTTSPNPAVGAVLVRDGVVVGEGFTQPPGQAHAEVGALQQAGPRSRGATLYVTLEPCCTHGRTPPCTSAIIAAGVSQVHMAVEDPNSLVSGKGARALEAAGISVYRGEGAQEVVGLYEPYAKHVRTGLPFITAKYASSLDGKIATSSGDSHWITGVEARRRVQQVRCEVDAILVGINTVMRDDPRLTARDEEGKPLPRQPLRVIVDSELRTPRNARMLAEPGHTLIAISRGATSEQPSLEVLRLPTDGNGRVDMGALMANLGQRGVVSLLVEGGGQVLGSLFDARLVDKVMAFIAPIIIGGKEAPSPVAGTGPQVLAEALHLERVTIEQLGQDILVTGYTESKG